MPLASEFLGRNDDEGGSYASTLISSGANCFHGTHSHSVRTPGGPPCFQQAATSSTNRCHSYNSYHGVPPSLPQLYTSPPPLPSLLSHSASMHRNNNVERQCSTTRSNGHRKRRRKPVCLKGHPPPPHLFESEYSVTSTTISPMSPKGRRRKTLLFIFGRRISVLFAVLCAALLAFFFSLLYIFVFQTGFNLFSSNNVGVDDSSTLDYYASPNSTHFYNPNAHYPNPSALVANSIEQPLPPHIHIGREVAFELPPRKIVYTQLSVQRHPHLVLNISLLPLSNIVLYARTTLRPTPAQHDFQRIISANRLHLTTTKSLTTNSGQKLSHVFVNHLFSPGNWFFGFLNDDSEVNYLRLLVTHSKQEQENDASNGVLSNTRCLFDCSGKGVCQNGKCQCHPGYSGLFCEETSCPVLCSGNGVFNGGHCICEEGFTGQECEKISKWCSKKDCGLHGRCNLQQKKCECNDGWTGEFCDEKQQNCSEMNCFGQGICHDGQCFCAFGWWGKHCEQRLNVSLLDSPTTTHHTLQTSRKRNKKQKEKCTEKTCEDGGICLNGDCKCFPGFRGERCEEHGELGCAPECELHGKCVGNGRCECSVGWVGTNCLIERCFDNCNNRGVCRLLADLEEWRCVCDPGFFGNSCEFVSGEVCDDGVDNDHDGLTDCEDSVECCHKSACSSNPMCFVNMAADEDDRKAFANLAPNTPFFDRVKFLLDGELATQRYADKSLLEPKRVALIRGQVFSALGGQLAGVRVSDAHNPQHGFTITRPTNHKKFGAKEEEEDAGWFNLVVNGGGFVTLQFIRQPYGRVLKSFFVPWNRIVNVGRIFLNKHNESFVNVKHASENECAKVNLFPTFVSRREDKLLQLFGSTRFDIFLWGEADTKLVHSSSQSRIYPSQILLWLTSDDMPKALKRVHFEISIAGRRFREVFAAAPMLFHTFYWDRKNVLGQLEFGVVDAEVSVGYEFTGCTFEHQIDWVHSRVLVEAQKSYPSLISAAKLAEPWRFNFLHHLDISNGVLEKGDSSDLLLDELIAPTLKTVIGNSGAEGDCLNEGSKKCERNRKPIGLAKLLHPKALAIGSNGAVFVGDHDRIKQITPDGRFVATLLELPPIDTFHRYHMAFDSSTDALFISLSKTRKIIRIVESAKASKTTDDNHITIIGNGKYCSESDKSKLCTNEGPLDNVRLEHPKGIEFDRDGNLYFADARHIRVLMKESRIVQFVVQSSPWDRHFLCSPSFAFDQLNLEWPTSMAIDAVSNDLYVLDDSQVIYRLRLSSKIVDVVVGRPISCRNTFYGEDLPDAIENIRSIAIDPVRRLLYLSQSGKHGLIVKFLRLDQETPVKLNIAAKINRCECHFSSSDECVCDKMPSEANDSLWANLAVHPQRGALYITDYENAKLLRLEKEELPFDHVDGQFRITPSSSNETFVFDRVGRHTSTVSLLSGKTSHSFTYTPDGRLDEVRMDNDNSMRVIKLVRANDSNLTLKLVGERAQQINLKFGRLADKSLLDAITNFAKIGGMLRFEYNLGQQLTLVCRQNNQCAKIAYNSRTRSVENVTTLPSGGFYRVMPFEFIQFHETKVSSGLTINGISDTKQLDFWP